MMQPCVDGLKHATSGSPAAPPFGTIVATGMELEAAKNSGQF